MKTIGRLLVPAAVLMLAACGGGEEQDEVSVDATTVGPAPGDSAGMTTPSAVDTAGVGTNPPTAGGSLVDTAAVPMSPDTSRSATTP